MEIIKEELITAEYLRTHPETIFVFGDNWDRKGYGGAALLRDEPNTYGFITKKSLSKKEPNYTPNEYISVFIKEIIKLRDTIKENPDKMFLISKLGAGLANKFNIWEEVISPMLPKILNEFENVVLLWN